MAQARHRDKQVAEKDWFEELPSPRPRIKRATVPRRGIVDLTFSDGTHGEVDFRPVIRKGGVLAPMANATFFKKVRVALRGSALAWPGELDFCADSLWLQATGKWNPE